MARNWVPVILGWRFLKLVSLVSLALGRFGNTVGCTGDNEGGSRGGNEYVYGAGLSRSGDGALRRDGSCVVMFKGIEMAVEGISGSGGRKSGGRFLERFRKSSVQVSVQVERRSVQQ